MFSHFFWLFSVLVCFSTATLTAQNTTKATLILNTGERIKGTIVDIVPQQHVIIQTADGTTLTVETDKIKEIRTPESVLAPSNGPSLLVGIDASYAISGGGYKLLEPKINFGGGKNGRVFGIGASFIYGTSSTLPLMSIFPTRLEQRTQLHFIPFYLNYRQQFGSKRIKPMFDVSVGYPLSLIVESVSAPVTVGNGYNYSVSQHKGLFYANLLPGVAFDFGQVSLGIGLKYNILGYTDAFGIIYKSEPSYGSIAQLDKKEATEKKTRIMQSIGLGLSFIY